MESSPYQVHIYMFLKEIKFRIGTGCSDIKVLSGLSIRIFPDKVKLFCAFILHATRPS